MIVGAFETSAVKKKLVECLLQFGSRGCVITPKYFLLESQVLRAKRNDTVVVEIPSDEQFNIERMTALVDALYNRVKKSDQVMTFRQLREGLAARNVQDLPDDEHLGDLFAACLARGHRTKLPTVQQDTRHPYTCLLDQGGVFLEFK